MVNPFHLSIILSIFVLSVFGVERSVRQTANGPVEGIEMLSSLGQKYYSFRGIPFAEPPITGIDPYTGEQVDRRFKAPEPLKRKWNNVLRAHNFGDSCITSSNLYPSWANRSEDCLSLNIYVPADGAHNKTVLVWIYGGGFTEGDYTDFTYGPDFLIAENNILVTVQYRVGIFGFLNLGNEEYSGNMGLKDQQLALKWVYENIENFSGNKNEILIFGESAGGASVSYQTLNEESRKYFNRAFLMSGSAYNYFALTRENHLNRIEECSMSQSSDNILEYLRTTEGEELAKCYFDFTWGKLLKPRWSPTLENAGTKGASITQSPDDIYNSNKPPVLDTLFSFNSQEQLGVDEEIIKNTEPFIRLNWKKSIVQLPYDDFNECSHLNKDKEALEKLRVAYYSDAKNSTAIIRANIALMSDLNFGYNILKNFIRQTVANNKGGDESQHKKTFLLRFDVNDELNLLKLSSDVQYATGAAHSDGLCYMFYCRSMDRNKTYDKHLSGRHSSAYKTIHRIVQIITNFARTGDPSIKDDTAFIPTTSPSEVFCQEITENQRSSITTNIREQIHYDTWLQIDEIYSKSSASSVHLHYGYTLLLLFVAYIATGLFVHSPF